MYLLVKLTRPDGPGCNIIGPSALAEDVIGHGCGPARDGGGTSRETQLQVSLTLNTE